MIIKKRQWKSQRSSGKAKEQRTEKFLKLRRVDVLTHLKNVASLQRMSIYNWDAKRFVG